MSIVQWLLLILVLAVVAGAYWYLRHASGSDPWQGMEDPAEADSSLDRGEALGGDSYIVGVRTLSEETPADRKAAVEGQSEGGTERRAREDEPVAPLRAFRQSRAAASGNPAPPAAEDEPARPAPAPAPAAQEEPGDEPEQVAPRRTSERVEMRAPSAQSEHQQIFILHVAAPEDQMFDGPAIHATLADADLKFGLNDIYHRVTEVHGVTESVFAVANMLKPGTLDPMDQDHLSTPGLAMFLMVPGVLEGRPAMHDMMETANRLATALGGQVLDDKRALLKAQTAQFMLDEIADLDRRAALAARRR